MDAAYADVSLLAVEEEIRRAEAALREDFRRFGPSDAVAAAAATEEPENARAAPTGARLSVSK